MVPLDAKYKERILPRWFLMEKKKNTIKNPGFLVPVFFSLLLHSPARAFSCFYKFER